MVIPLFIYTFVPDYQIIILNEMGIGVVGTLLHVFFLIINFF